MFHVLMRDATFDPSRFRSLRSGIIAGGSVSEILADRGRARCDVEIANGLPDIGPTVSVVDFVTGALRGPMAVAEPAVHEPHQLRACPVVDDPCVTGIPHDLLGELVCAGIVTVPDLVRLFDPFPMTGSGSAKRRAFECDHALDHTAIIGSS